ncbi:MAG: hypothetical protein JRF33_18680 [Deltaproteobacteria bacterium]|nr:hypothetical protein [Deltaproteobacteria bacterium]
MFRIRRLCLVILAIVAVFACARYGFDGSGESALVFPADEEPAFGGAELNQIEVDAFGARLLRLPGFATLDARLPVPAAAGSAEALGKRFYFGGGNEAFPSQGACNDRFLVLDPDTGLLSSLTNLPLPKRGMDAVAWHGEIFFMMGYASGQSDAEEQKIYAYDPLTGLFSYKASYPDQVYYFSAGLVPFGEGVAAVAVGGLGSGPIKDVVQAFDLSTGDTWAFAQVLPEKNNLMAGAVANDVFYIFGGTGDEDQPLINTVDLTKSSIYAIEADPIRIEHIGDLGAPVAAACAVRQADGSIMIFGGERYVPGRVAGYGLEVLDQVIQFDPADFSHKVYAETLPEPRSAMACAVNDRGQVVLFGGADGERTSHDQIWAFEPYAELGSVTSQPVDSGFAGVRWSWLTAAAELPETCGLTFKLRMADSQDELQSSTWVEVQVGELDPSLPRGRYVQWQAEFTSTNPLATPVLNKVALVYATQD